MMLFAQTLVALVCGLAIAPLGLLPSVFLFRDLADGRSSGVRTERAYAFTVWLGLITTFAIGALSGRAIFALT